MSDKKFQKSLNWNIIIEEKKLFITKGSDEIYFLDEVPEEQAQIIYDAYKSNNLDELYAKEKSLQPIINKLEMAGVIYKGKESEGDTTSNISVNFKWYGSKNEKIQMLLTQFISESQDISISNNLKTSDLLILIRTSGNLSDIMSDYKEVDIPHIFIDVAYDHTISVGPMVFPKETACLGCFIGRITRNWGDAEPPRVPSATKSAEIIASFIFEHIKIFQKFGNCPELVNQVFTFNLNDFTIKYDKVFKLPWCPNCFNEKTPEGTGSFELPWKRRDSI
ncbi:MAG: hypothetical protein A2Y24_06120 [Clostridiales bacterium GWE2_32_10]|nr:MAG: hypothetical protein A2Y24_06120 [Clostridiales bacterium GWE2_32_10]HBY21540.1 hypothetical protein [Clostridiales bacterium]